MDNVINLFKNFASIVLPKKIPDVPLSENMGEACLQNLLSKRDALIAVNPKFDEHPPIEAQQFAVAVYSMIRHWIVQDYPQLIQSVEPGKVVFYNGLTVQAIDGSISVLPPAGFRPYKLNDKVFALGNRMIDYCDDMYRSDCHTKLSLILTVDTRGSDYVAHMVQWVLSKFNLKIWGLKGKRILHKTVDKRLWDMGIWDKELFGMMVKMKTVRNLSVSEYNQYIANKSQLKKRLQEAPSLAPLVGRCGIDLLASDNLFQHLKEKFISEGGTPVGWRWLTKQKTSAVHVLLNEHGMFHSWEMINALANSGVEQLYTIPQFGSLLRYKQTPDMTARSAELMKSASLARKSRKLLARDLANQWQLVMDYVRYNPSKSVAKKSWANLMKLQDRWHRDELMLRIREEIESGRVFFWHPVVQEVKDDKFIAISLNNTTELMVEGYTMSHCVGGYSMTCYRNASRIYAVSDHEGKRVATIQASMSNDKWIVNQCYGYQNAIVSIEVTKFAQSLVAVLNRNKMPKAENTMKQLNPEETQQLLQTYGLAA